MSRIAKVLYTLGFRPNVSTGVCGGTTYGYGKLDPNGYWQFLLKIEYEEL